MWGSRFGRNWKINNRKFTGELGKKTLKLWTVFAGKDHSRGYFPIKNNDVITFSPCSDCIAVAVCTRTNCSHCGSASLKEKSRLSPEGWIAPVLQPASKIVPESSERYSAHCL